MHFGAENPFSLFAVALRESGSFYILALRSKRKKGTWNKSVWSEKILDKL